MSNVGFYSTEGWEKERLKEVLGEDFPISFYEDALNADGVEAAVQHDVIVVRPDSMLDKERIDSLPNLKAIVTRSTGFDHIDTSCARAKGITIQNVPAYGASSVAEHAFALLLALSKRITDGYEQVRERTDFDPRRLRGFDLAGKTLGVIGTGTIGRHAIQIGKGFGMPIIAYDIQPDSAYAQEAGISYVSIEELLEKSDVVTIHIPANESTRHLINTDNISRMKVGAVLINTSRGAVVETQAVVKGLAEGRLRGAGLDVFEEEPTMRDELHLLAKDHIEEDDYA
jgi:D-lactate dehydrogenase